MILVYSMVHILGTLVLSEKGNDVLLGLPATLIVDGAIFLGFVLKVMANFSGVHIA